MQTTNMKIIVIFLIIFSSVCTQTTAAQKLIPLTKKGYTIKSPAGWVIDSPNKWEQILSFFLCWKMEQINSGKM